MTRTLSRLPALPLLVLCLVSLAHAQEPAARMDQIVQTYVDAKQFMGTVLVARGDRVVFNNAYGSANLEWSIPNTPATKFRLGSVTKQFTAAAVLLLEERGKLKVEDPIKKYFSAAPAAWEKITIFHLLTHTSGIRNFTSLSDYNSLKMFRAPVDKTIERFAKEPLDFEPGERMSYSNSGYLLLGSLIEKVSGTSYERFVQDNIFAPLGMKDSGLDSNSAIVARRASGYTSSPAGFVNAPFIDMSIPHGAGALYSTTEDLLRWTQGLFGGKLLSAASLQKMTTPFKENYAFGVNAASAAGRKRIFHGGGIEGFNTFLAYFPETSVTAVALSNVSGSAPQEIVEKLGVVAHGEGIVLTSERKEIAVPAAVLQRYVGVYSIAPQVNLTITLDAERLMVQLSGQGRNPLFAESQTRFFTKVVDAQVEFFTQPDGRASHLVLYQNGRETKAMRTGDPPPERRAITLPENKLRDYAGTFELRPGFDLVITLEGSQLMSQATGQPKVALHAEAENRFFLKEVDAQLEFERDAQGAVSHVTLHQGRTHVKAAKK